MVLNKSLEYSRLLYISDNYLSQNPPTLTLVGSGNTLRANSFNVTSLASNYSQLTNNNFVVCYTGINFMNEGTLQSQGLSTTQTITGFSYSYNPSTGIVSTTVSRYSIAGCACYANFSVYLIN